MIDYIDMSRPITLTVYFGAYVLLIQAAILLDFAAVLRRASFAVDSSRLNVTDL